MNPDPRNIIICSDGKDNLVSYASRIYNKNYNRKTTAAFNQTYCRKCVPYFIGVWDTVASLGYFLGKKFFDDDLHGKGSGSSGNRSPATYRKRPLTIGAPWAG